MTCTHNNYGNVSASDVTQKHTDPAFNQNIMGLDSDDTKTLMNTYTQMTHLNKTAWAYQSQWK